MKFRRSSAACAAAAALLISGVAPGAANAHPGGTDPRDAEELVEILEKATKDFRDVEDAVKAGYLPASPCVEEPGVGAMGVHYVKGALVDKIVDPKAPEVLVFMPDDRGRFDLVAVEFLTYGLEQAPSIAGIPFETGPFDGNHSLHAWIYEENPNGTFVGFNPAISCP